MAIEPPELEMRVAILINKARAEAWKCRGSRLLRGQNVRSNVRELEGALRKIFGLQPLQPEGNLHPAGARGLRDLLSIQNRQISVENIQKTVADYYKIKVADMYSKKRPASIARPRQIAMYLAKELTQKSLPEIGELFGGRDHTTVLHAVRKMAAERQQLTELNQQLHVLEQTLRADALQVMRSPMKRPAKGKMACCAAGRGTTHAAVRAPFPETQEVDMIVPKATQDKVLAVLQSVAGIVERRHTLPILANVLIRKTGNALQLTTSDLEVQIRTTAELGGDTGDFTTTVNARKIIDVCAPCPRTRR